VVSSSQSQSSYRLAAVVLIVLGVLALIGGVVYLANSAASLPSFFPGHLSTSVHGHNQHRTKRGTAGVVVGVVLLIVGGTVAWMGARPGVRQASRA
jgi:uncharacterized membrane protein HdeD (DUF308 family)